MKKHLLLAALATMFASSSAVAADGDITVTVDLNNCRRSSLHFQDTKTTHWFQCWESQPEDETITPKVGITQDFEGNARMNDNEQAANTNLFIQATTTANQQSYYMTVRTENSGYYISSYTLTATPAADGASINGTALSTDGTVISATGTPSDENLYFTVELNSENATVNNIKLTDFTITLSPKPVEEPTIRYVQVSSVHQIVDGANYVVGAVNANASAANNFPRFYDMKAAGDAVQQTVKRDNTNFPSSMVWTLQKIEGKTCASTAEHHANTSPVFAMVQDGKAIINSGSKNELTLSTANPLPATTYIEFIPVSSSHFADETLFLIHIDWNESQSQFLACRPMGTGGNKFNRYTDKNNSQGTNIAQIIDNDPTWSDVHRLYLQVDPENLEPAAKAYWNELIEEDIAANPSYTDDFKATLRARELPDVTEMTADNLQSELAAIYNAPFADFSTDGWYQILAISAPSLDPGNQYIANVETEYQQSSTNYYPLKFITEVPADKPAKTFVHIRKNGTSGVYITSANGHKLAANATATIAANAPSIPLFAVSGHNDRYKLGDVWGSYIPNTQTSTEQPYVGKFSNNNNQMQFYAAHPESTYDIWSVTIQGESALANLANNIKVTLDHEANKGLDAVYNNGTFFVTKGTELTEANFTVSTNTSNSNHYPVITVNNEEHTVTVDLNAYKLPINMTTGTLSGGSSSWKNLWTSSASANFPFTVTLQARNNDGKAVINNMANSNGILVLAAGDNGCGYELAINSGDFYIAKYTMDAIYTGSKNLPSFFPAESTAANGIQMSKTETKTFAADVTYPNPANFRVQHVNGPNTNANGDNNTSNFYIYLYPVTDEMAQTVRDDLNEYAHNHLDIYTHFPALWSEEAVNNALTTASSAIDAAITANIATMPAKPTIAQIDAQKTSLQQTIIAIPELHAALADSISGKVVAFQNLDRKTDKFMGVNNDHQLDNTATSRHELASMWLLTADSETPGALFLTNQKSHESMVNQLVDSKVATATTGNAFYLEPYAVVKNGTTHYVVGIRATNINGNKYIHASNANNSNIMYTAPNQDQGSAWKVFNAEEDEIAEDIDFNLDLKQSVEGEATTNGHVFTFSHEQSIALNEGVTENVHVITLRQVTPKQTETTTPESVIRRKAANVSKDMYDYTDSEPIEISLHNATATDNGLSVEATGLNPERLDKCYYEVTVPTGVFTVGEGKHNKAQTMVFTVDANGGVTGIENVEANVAAPAVDVIFDLQGRRLSKPMRGINIINGHKVLVK